MKRPTPSYSRRMSAESITTSEFEVISRHGSSCGNTVRGSDSDDESATHQKHSSSDYMPPPYSEFVRNGQEALLDDYNIRETPTTLSSDLISMSHSRSLMSESCFSEISMLEKESAALSEQKMSEGDEKWRVKIAQLMERNRMLEKSLISSKSRGNQQEQEIEQLRQQNVELSEQVKRLQGLPTKDSSSSWYRRFFALGIIVAVLALYIICYAQLLNERRNNEGLKDVLDRMSDIVDKLETKHKAEYEQLLEEMTRQIADDMNININLARKERELEHERLIEAYREKMLLYNDLDELRKKYLQKSNRKRRSSFEF